MYMWISVEYLIEQYRSRGGSGQPKRAPTNRHECETRRGLPQLEAIRQQGTSAEEHPGRETPGAVLVFKPPLAKTERQRVGGATVALP